jgi:hypothetical protein
VAGLLRRLFPRKDPYWDRFVNQPFVDPKNLMIDMISESPGGGVFAVKTDIHDPAATSGHMTELAKFWGASCAGVTVTDPAWLQPSPSDEDGEAHVDANAIAAKFPHAIVCGVLRTFDAEAAGMGGRLPEQKLAVANFNIRSYIREIGYNAIFATPTSGELPATAAGRGEPGKHGRFVAGDNGGELVVGQVVLTDLPLDPALGKP